MNSLLKLILLIIIIIVLLFIILCIYRTWKTQNSPNQKLFLHGEVPNPKLQGLYKGSVTGYKGNWQGKEFDAKTSLGINVFRENGKEQKSYPFKTYAGKGLQDKNLDVLKIDYNTRKNPLWVRFVLDELVEVEPNKYLGKLHIRFLPILSFSLGYFRLEK